MAKRLTLYIMIGLVLGIVVGAAMNASMTPEAIAEANKFFKMITDIFLRLIKMIVAPLVFATLVAGIVHMGDTKSLGRVGGKTIIWFLGATVVSLSLGMLLVIVAGHIDLSVGSVAGFIGAVAAVLMVQYKLDPLLAAVIRPRRSCAASTRWSKSCSWSRTTSCWSRRSQCSRRWPM